MGSFPETYINLILVSLLKFQPEGPEFNPRPNRWLDLFLVVPGVTSRSCLKEIAKWFASRQLEFLTMLCLHIFLSFRICGPQCKLLVNQ